MILEESDLRIPIIPLQDVSIDLRFIVSFPTSQVDNMTEEFLYLLNVSIWSVHERREFTSSA